VEAGRGVAWLEQGVKLLLRNPTIFLVNALIYAVIVVAILQLNFVAGMAGVLLSMIIGAAIEPALFAGLVYAYREEDRGGKAEIPHLFQGAQAPGKLIPLLMLGAPRLAVGIVMMVLGQLILGSALMGAGLSSIGALGASLSSLGGKFALLALIGLALGAGALMMVIFAIPRVMFDGIDPIEAMKESVSACLSNIAPLLILGVLLLVGVVVLGFVLSFLNMIGVLLLTMATGAVASAAVYLAYREIFGGSAAAIPPPAPPA
jgi:uncharacterized membrane protein